MALILSLETSASTCSVAIHHNGDLIKENTIAEPQAHASKLAVLIRSIFEGSSYRIGDLDAIAVSSGPGSYTGLRIGTSTAKGLCYARNIPLIALPTLDIMVEQVGSTNPSLDRLLCPMIDAKRMEVYFKVVGPTGALIRDVSAAEIHDNSFAELLESNQMLFFGDGAKKCRAIITHEHAAFLDDTTVSAADMGKLAFEKFARQAFEDIVHFEPFYFKEFIAKTASKLF